MNKNYTILHLHSMDSNPNSGLEVDSVTRFEDYILKAKECGMKAMAFTEHGCMLHNVAKKQTCEKNGIKLIQAQEFYITETLDPENRIRDNYHCLLYAKNKDGVEELLQLSSLAFEPDHKYYNPRISLEELENTSDNILILTGCVAGMLCKGTPEVKQRFSDFIMKNKHRVWLELQPHNFDLQKQYNAFLVEQAKKYGLKLIATNDIHALAEEHLLGRQIMQQSKLKEPFHDEDQCNLLFQDYNGMVCLFKQQNAIPEDVYLEALEETNRFADLVEDYELDYSNKYPRFKNSEEDFKQRINRGVKERGIDKLPNYKTEYLPRIREEFETYKKNDAIDFMILDADYKNWMRENGMHYGPSRGSVSGSIIAYLLHNTDVDSIKYDLNFSRFMNPERASLADVDTDIYKEDRYKVREYFFGRKDLHCCNILTYNTIQMRGAIKDVGRALGYTPDETQNISNQVTTDENGNDKLPDKVIEQYPELSKYVNIVIGTIVSLGRHAAGIVCSPIDLQKAFGTLYIKADPRPVSQIDMHEIDSLNFVKMDLLGLHAVGLIDQACKLARIPYRTMDNTDLSDEKVIQSIAEDTTLIFQFESGFASDCLKRMLSEKTLTKIKDKNPNVSYLDLFSMVNGVIRPAGESFRDKMLAGEYRDNGNKALNDFLSSTLGYLTYQEQIIDFLHDFCGFTMGQADIVRRGFAKKSGTDKFIPVIKDGGYLEDIHGNKDDRYIKGFVATAQEKYGMSKDEAENTIVYFLKVIDDASSYLFSKNHAVPYSAIGLFIGWLRYYYPLELFTAALNIYQGNQEKMSNIIAYIKSKGIEIKPIRFGKSRAGYFMDKKENCIYQGIESIKDCNGEFAEELFQLRDNHYESFVDLLEDLENTSIKKNQLDILIKLEYFSDFGDIRYLLMCRDIFDKYYGKVQIKKQTALNDGIDMELMRECCEKEAPKTFMGVNTMKLINLLVAKIPEQYTSLKTKIAYQQELLGFVNVVDKKYRGICVVMDISTKYTPKAKLYALANGNIISVKIQKKIYEEEPFVKGDILRIYDRGCVKQPKKLYIEGHWVNSDTEKEWWLYNYTIQNSLGETL